MTELASKAQTIMQAATPNWIMRAKAMGWKADELEEMKAPTGAVTAMKTYQQSDIDGTGVGSVREWVSQASRQGGFFRIVADRLARTVPLDTPLVTATLPVDPATVPEGAEIPTFDLSLDGKILRASKVGAILVATKEAYENTSSEGQSFINALLTDGLSRAADRALFNALTAVPPIAFAAIRTDAAAVVAAMKDAAAALSDRAGQKFIWLLSPDVVPYISGLDHTAVKVGLDGTGTVFGSPVQISDGAAPGSVSLVRTSDIVARLDNLSISKGSQGTVNINGEQVSLFQTNSVAVRALLNVAVEPLTTDVMATISLTEA